MKVYMVLDLDFYSSKGDIDTDCSCVYVGKSKESAIKHLNDYVKTWNDGVRDDMTECPDDFDGETIELIDDPMATDNAFEDFVLYYSHTCPNGDWHNMFVKIEEREMEDK